MRSTKKILAAAVAASTLSVASLAPVANAEVAASVSIASAYLWRGYDLGNGQPAVSGDLVASSNGFYGGVWVSSGDAGAGTEYDLFAGYGGEVGNFSYDLSLVSYQYPRGIFYDTEGTPGDFVEAVVSLGVGPVSFTYFDNIAGDNGGYAPSEDYAYMTLGAEFGAMSVLLGHHDFGDEDDTTMTHIDLSYSYNDNLAFTLSAVADSDEDEDPEPTIVVSYSIPIE